MTKIGGLLIALMFLFFAGVIKADGLTITNIGVLSTSGVDYSLVNYTGGIPTLVGTATSGAQIAVKIQTVVGYATAASPSGVWQFVPASLDVGSNTVLVTSGSQSISFILNYNSTVSATPTATPSPTPEIINLPETGTWGYFIPIVGFGLLVLYLGNYAKKMMHKWEGKIK